MTIVDVPCPRWSGEVNATSDVRARSRDLGPHTLRRAFITAHGDPGGMPVQPAPSASMTFGPSTLFTVARSMAR